MIFNFRGNWKSMESGSKNYSKSKAKMEGILALIFGGFGSVLGGKLVREIDQKSIRESIGNMMQNKSRFERGFGPKKAPKT